MKLAVFLPIGGAHTRPGAIPSRVSAIAVRKSTRFILIMPGCCQNTEMTRGWVNPEIKVTLPPYPHEAASTKGYLPRDFILRSTGTRKSSSAVMSSGEPTTTGLPLIGLSKITLTCLARSSIPRTPIKSGPNQAVR